MDKKLKAREEKLIKHEKLIHHLEPRIAYFFLNYLNIINKFKNQLLFTLNLQLIICKLFFFLDLKNNQIRILKARLKNFLENMKSKRKLRTLEILNHVLTENLNKYKLKK